MSQEKKNGECGFEWRSRGKRQIEIFHARGSGQSREEPWVGISRVLTLYSLVLGLVMHQCTRYAGTARGAAAELSILSTSHPYTPHYG
jgi:hypothetical protein